MTVIRNDRGDAFVSRPPPEIQFYLVHGMDQGLIHERARRLAEALLGRDANRLCITRIDGDSISNEPGRLADEVYAIPMLGEHRVVWIDAQSRDLARLVEPLFASPPKNCALILEAGNLKKGAMLRKTFETAPNAASIECYPDEGRALSSLIDAAAREAGVEVSTAARDSLLTHLGSDRMTTRAEVAKLMLYATGGRRVELADVETIITDASPSVLGELIDRAFLGEMAEVERLTGRFFGDGGDAGLLLARLISRLSLLCSLRSDVEQGKSVETVLQMHLVRLPQQGRAALARQVERWTLSALKGSLPAVHRAAAKVRRDARLAQVIVTRVLWAMTSTSSLSRG